MAESVDSGFDPERAEAVIALVVSLLRARLLQGRRESYRRILVTEGIQAAAI